jgi:hypothetical protein
MSNLLQMQIFIFLLTINNFPKTKSNNSDIMRLMSTMNFFEFSINFERR